MTCFCECLFSSLLRDYKLFIIFCFCIFEDNVAKRSVHRYPDEKVSFGDLVRLIVSFP